jgi:hypothetical protein
MSESLRQYIAARGLDEVSVLNEEKNTAQAPCPKCDGRGYRGGYCLDCGQYWHGEKNATTNARTVGKRFLEAWAISQAAFEHDYD